MKKRCIVKFKPEVMPLGGSGVDACTEEERRERRF